MAMPDTTPTVDPALVADEENVQISRLLYSGLVRLDSNYQVTPDAAARYSVSSDHLRYTFYLRHGLRFSNGDPLTAQDFKYSIDRSLNPALKSPSAPTFLLDIKGAPAVLSGKSTHVSGVRMLDQYTLQITIRWPVSYFLTELTYPTSFALDAKRLARLNRGDLSSWYSNPVGSGPYRLKSWRANTIMVLVPNPYFGGTPPGVKQITIALSSLPTTGVYKFVARNFDIVNLPASDRSLSGRIGVWEGDTLAINGIYMNPHLKPFSDVHVRRAFTLAVDRLRRVTSSIGPSATPFAGYVPSGEGGYFSKLTTFPFDPARALRALESAGYDSSDKFPPVTLYYPDDPALAKLARSLSQSWNKNLHVRVDTQPLTVNTLYARVQANSLPLYLLGWSADYPDPHDWLTLQWATGAVDNNVRYSNPFFDHLVATADVTWNWSQRQSLYDRSQQLLADDAAWIPLYIPRHRVYIRPSVRNLFLTGYGLIPRFGAWSQVWVQAPLAKRAGPRIKYN